MASRTQEFTTTIFLNDQQAKNEIAALEAKIKTIRKDMDDAAKTAKKTGDWTDFNNLKKELGNTTKQLNAMRTSAQQVDHVLENLSGASIKEIKNTIKAINKELFSGNVERGTDKWNFLNEALRNCKEELKQIKDESAAIENGTGKSTFWDKLVKLNNIGFAITNFFGLEEGISGIIGKVQSLAQESMEVAKNAEGIEIAFQRINKPGLLENLRKETHGTIDDIQLMQQAVKFQNFDLPVEQLGKLLAFAQQTAKDTGQSIDYMVNSIVDGMSRQSVKILDNLGLSATKIKEKVAETGDFTTGVIAMIEERMDGMGEYTDTAADRAARATARVVNAQKELGEQLLPIRSQLASVFGQTKLGMLNALTWILKNRSAFVSLAKVVAVWAATMTAAMLVDKAATLQAKLHAAAVTVNTALTKAWTVAVNVQKSALLALKLVVVLCTGGVNAYTAALEKAKAASMTNPWTALATVILTVGTAIYAGIKLMQRHKQAAKEAADATNIFLLNQKNMQDVTKEANQKVSEEITRLDVLYRKLKDSKAAYSERKKALEEIKKIVPDYHGALTKEGELINDNTKALRDYCDNLIKAARAQAAFNKMVQIQESSMNHEDLLKGREQNQQWVLKQMAKYGYDPSQGDEYRYLVGQGVYVRDRYGNKKSDKALTKQQVAELQHLQSIYDYNERRKKEENAILATQARQTEELRKQAELGASGDSGSSSGKSNTSTTTTYQTEAEKKAAATAAHKAEVEARRQRREAIQNEINDIKTANDEKLAENTILYYTGKRDYQAYVAEQHRLTIESLQQQLKVYQNYGEKSKQLEAEIAKEQLAMKEDEGKQNIAKLEKDYALRKVRLQSMQYDSDSPFYHNEDAMAEASFRLQDEYLKKKRKLQIDGSEDAAETDAQIQELTEQHKLELAQKHEERLQQYREQFGKMDAEAQKQIALNGFDAVMQVELAKYEEGSDEKLKAEKEFQEMKKQIILYYNQQESEQNLQNSKGESLKRNAYTAYETASNNAKADYSNAHPTGGSMLDYLGSDVTIFSSTLANIKEMEKEGVISHEEAMAAMGEATSDMCAGIASKMQAAYDAVSPIMNAMSSYYSAQCDLEVAQTEKKYEKQINAVGNNEAKRKKLEEKQQKEVAKIKTKYNRKQMKMQIAQAIAETAMNAISAYGSVWSSKMPLSVKTVLAPIMAGVALAAGAIQIATIKKQQQAQEAGYYEGGFTGGSSYRREAGVVHEGEFVANHNAVNNPQLLPALQLIDIAQRNNTVGSLTAADVSRSMGVGGTAIVNQTPVIVNNDNSELQGTLQEARETIGRLGALLESGDIIVRMPDWDDFDRSRKHYDNLQSNK